MKKIFAIAIPIIILLLAGLCIMIFYDGEGDTGERVTPVGVILNGKKDDLSWSNSHYDALEKTGETLDLSITYTESVTTDTIAAVIQEYVDNGCEIIIANSFEFGDAMKRAAKKYPHIYFFHCSGVDEGKNLTSYFGRMYQIRYLTGVVAGMQTKKDSVGYVAAFPISEVNRGINAFALGVRSVNPDAKIHVRWINSWIADEAAAAATKELISECGVDVLAMHTDSVAPLKVAEEYGVMSIGYNRANPELCPETYLTAAVWDWERFYTVHIRHCLQEKFLGDNYWDGINTGIVAMAELSEKAEPGIAQAVKDEYDKLISGTTDVFYGPVYDRDGNLRIEEGESMTDYSMLNEFDWYVEGVVTDEE